jgi:hypothetical protein
MIWNSVIIGIEENPQNFYFANELQRQSDDVDFRFQ